MRRQVVLQYVQKEFKTTWAQDTRKRNVNASSKTAPFNSNGPDLLSMQGDAKTASFKNWSQVCGEENKFKFVFK